jgi:hypothetical protein
MVIVRLTPFVCTFVCALWMRPQSAIHEVRLTETLLKPTERLMHSFATYSYHVPMPCSLNDLLSGTKYSRHGLPYFFIYNFNHNVAAN